MHELADTLQCLFVLLHLDQSEHDVVLRLMHVQRTESDIRQVSLVAGTWHCVIVVFVFLLLLTFDRGFKIHYRLNIVTTIEVHDATVEVEILLPEDVLLVVAIGLNLTGLLLELLISVIIQFEGRLDFLAFLTPICLLLDPLATECPYFFNFNPLNIGYDLLMLADGTDWGMDVGFNVIGSIEDFRISDDGPLERFWVITLFGLW